MATSLGPSAAALIILLPSVGVIPALLVAPLAFAITYFVSRAVLTERLRKGLEN